ncbi:hypothetical protein [Roseovarius sp. 2305UL8-3]|uniref:hypothetical protein n=1 Tax=Roseovarius conchicola TaxID=3121636 RepID=UPI0035292A68
MSAQPNMRGGTPVGLLTELSPVEAGAVIYLRLWSEGPDRYPEIWNDFSSCLGAQYGEKALKSFEDLCNLCAAYGRRPLMRHSVNCKCLGADEACFANFIGAAAEGEREDALMIATVIVRADMAQPLVSLAQDFGLAMKRMSSHLTRAENTPPPSTVYH